MAMALLLVCCAAPEDRTREDKLARIDRMYEHYREEFPEVPGITVDELVAALEGEAPPVLVDVRSAAEREVSIIPGAITSEEFEARMDELEDRPVVTYCTIGYRSGLYANGLLSRGWDARNLEGSILAWTYSGRPLESDGQPTRRVHVYGKRWNLAAEDFESVW